MTSVFTWFGGWAAVARIGVTVALNAGTVAVIAFTVSNYVAQTSMAAFTSTAASIEDGIDRVNETVLALDDRLSTQLLQIRSDHRTFYEKVDQRIDVLDRGQHGQSVHLQYLQERLAGLYEARYVPGVANPPVQNRIFTPGGTTYQFRVPGTSSEESATSGAEHSPR